MTTVGRLKVSIANTGGAIILNINIVVKTCNSAQCMYLTNKAFITFNHRLRPRNSIQSTDIYKTLSVIL